MLAPPRFALASSICCQVSSSAVAFRTSRKMPLGVVDEDVLLGHAVLANRHHLELGGLGVEANALLVVLAEEERLARLHAQELLGPGRLVGDGGERAVVEDRAVLVD